ncbi:nuclear transport factor 2 family protein [Tunturiibacter lichenicola]|uniref:nuclear transport factor 2 family protein n=1 Tax=Tunturiibacter lichenicola TaxID=2051959 RepID=UPI0021B2A3F8|nr:DUF4440 domain-containing protein [Edaphobacter lichenicola]
MRPQMEPVLSTDAALLAILEELKQREPIFHRPEFGTTRADFEGMMHTDFWEIGASGRRYAREYVLNELEKRHQHPQKEEWETSEFHCRLLAPDLYLLTYTLIQDKIRKTRRSTIWQYTLLGWKIVFHQGTVVEDE